MPIRQTASVKTDSVTTHIVRVDIAEGVLPSMGNDDICEIYLQIAPKQPNHPPVLKKVKLNYRDMTTLTSEFVLRNY
jgi:hypothetical protein